MRTFTAQQLDEANRQWAYFSEEWLPWWSRALQRGIIYPPSGTRHDSWEDDVASQRALIYRAMRETPLLLAEAIAASSSWSEVLTRVLGGRDALRAIAERRELDDDARKRAATPSRNEARTLAQRFGWKR